MRELLENAKEFLESGEENIKSKRNNAAVADFFKAIVILCDDKLYSEIRSLPKNHTERFKLLQQHFPGIYMKVSALFKKYTDSYNFRLTSKDANTIKSYAYELYNTTANNK